MEEKFLYSSEFMCPDLLRTCLVYALSPSFVIHCISLPWWLGWSRICLQCRKLGFDAWVWKIPWRREWLPTPVVMPGELHGQKSRRVVVSEVAKSWTQLSNWHIHFCISFHSQKCSNMDDKLCGPINYGCKVKTHRLKVKWINAGIWLINKICFLKAWIKW